ncbi:MAG: hypothetical protein OFPII_16460 [Osedax symbiont Rs1]|nr:MAG: hypothetical protein OFPII_16460 [Osedax symbiont Rs1]
MTSLHYIAQALDSTAVRKIPAEPTGAAKIFQFHCRTNILHSVFTLKSQIQVLSKAAVISLLEINFYCASPLPRSDFVFDDIAARCSAIGDS